MRAALFLPLLLLPAMAQGKEAERYDCTVMRLCDLGQPCRDVADTRLSLVIDTGDLTVTYEGQTLRTGFDPRLRQANWRLGDRVMQMRFVGDGSGVILTTPESGDVDLAQVQVFQCSPA